MFFMCAFYGATCQLAAGIILPAQDTEAAEEEREDLDADVSEFEPDWEASGVGASSASPWMGYRN